MPQTDKGGGKGKKGGLLHATLGRSFLFFRGTGREGERRDQKIGRSLISSEKKRRRDSEIDTQKKDASKREGKKKRIGGGS